MSVRPHLRKIVLVAMAGLVGLSALAVGGAYAYLALTTRHQPAPAALPPVPTGTSVAFSPSDPTGRWVIAPGNSSFVGYRARELLAFDFVPAPNEAVGRTTVVRGSIEVAAGRLQRADITGDVSKLRSDDSLRDGHLVEGLELETYPMASFTLATPVELSTPTRGIAIKPTVQGDLSIHGQTKPVAVTLEARWDGATVSVAGSMVIHRADYGLDMPRLLLFKVADDITIEFQLRFVPSCAPRCIAGGPSASAGPSAIASARPSPTPSTSGHLVSTAGQLAFGGFTDRGGAGPPIQDIYVVNPDGKGLRRLTDQGAFADYPAWSPDARSIAYTLIGENSEKGLWVVGLDGSVPRQLTTQPARHPAWSPSGDRIAFVSPLGEDAGAAGDLYLIHADGSGLQKVPLPPGAVDHPSWSPDGQRLTFTFFAQNGNRESIYIANRDGTAPRPLIEAGTYSYAASWSPDGRRIVFVEDAQVAIATADGRNVRVITSNRAVDRPGFSPDGTRIVFTQNDGIWVMNADGTGATTIKPPFDFSGFAAWNPRA